MDILDQIFMVQSPDFNMRNPFQDSAGIDRLKFKEVSLNHLHQAWLESIQGEDQTKDQNEGNNENEDLLLLI